MKGRLLLLTSTFLSGDLKEESTQLFSRKQDKWIKFIRRNVCIRAQGAYMNIVLYLHHMGKQAFLPPCPGRCFLTCM